MKHAPAVLAAFVALGLTACGPAAEPPADAPAAATPAPAPAAQGAAYAPTEALLAKDSVTFPNPAGRGTGFTATFGQPQADVISSLTIFRGAPPEVTQNSECGAGPLTFASWGDGFQLLFQEGAFAGWFAHDDAPRGFTTETGIGIGSTVAQLRAAHPGLTLTDGSLGPEFAADDVFGIASAMGPEGEINALWAGVSCNFR